MLDSLTERSLTYRLGAAYDCWGHRRALKHGVRNGIWFLDPIGLGERLPEEAAADTVSDRERKLAAFAASARFTPTEIATLRALVVERLTINQVAQRDGCSRQAVLARLVGNSRGQGGILKKAQALLSARNLSDEGVQRPPGRTRTDQPLRRAHGRRGGAA